MSPPAHHDEGGAALAREWIRVGLGCGLAAGAVYPALLLLPGPPHLVLVLAAAFGPLLALGTVGLYHLAALHRRSVPLQVGVAASVAGGVLFTAMALVQLAVRRTAADAAAGLAGATSPEAVTVVRHALDGVQLGLDVAWDLGIGLGVLGFAWALRDHPRFGWFFTVPGLAIGAALLVLNLASFPIPPANAGMLDVGPLVGLWFLLVTVQALRSLGWADERLAAGSGTGVRAGAGD